MNFILTLKSFTYLNDQFFRVHDFRGNEIIIYSFGGHLYKPRCVKIPSINLQTLENCYEDIPVTFMVGPSLEKGFLTQERIIKTHSKEISCPNIARFINLPVIGKTISILNQKIDIVDTKNVKFGVINYSDDLSFPELTHNDIIIGGIDILGQFHNLSLTVENGNQWLTISKPELIIQNSWLGGFKNFISLFLDLAWLIIKWFIGIVTSIVLLFCLFKLVTFFLKEYFKYRRNKQNESPPIYFNKDEVTIPLADLTHPTTSTNQNIDTTSMENDSVITSEQNPYVPVNRNRGNTTGLSSFKFPNLFKLMRRSHHLASITSLNTVTRNGNE